MKAKEGKEEEKIGGNQSLIRGLTLIDLLSNYPNGCPLAKLAELANLNKSTTHRLLQGLQQQGFIQPAMSAGSYRLSTKCLTIGHKMFNSMNIINLAAPHLERLNLALGETVNFSMRQQDHAVMIYKLEPTTGMLHTRAYIGQQIQLFCSAMGKIYMAYDKTDYLTQYWQRQQAIIQPLTCNTITTEEVMAQELAQIRKQGYALDNEENEQGVCCLACPVFNFKNEVEYALSVSLPMFKFNQIGIELMLAETRYSAQQISFELGWSENS